eukprot:9382415-Lingulodinium_polyedra.AAC.1
MAAEMHQSTWFDVVGCEGQALAGKGPRAGDPWGDFVFNAVALVVAEETSTLLHQRGLAVQLRGRARQWQGAQ